MYRIAKEAMFSASHHLREYNGKCENVHGHNYRVVVVVCGKQLGKNGLLLDFVELKAAMGEVLGRLDHVDLNITPPFDIIEPSAENIAKHIVDELASAIDTDIIRVAEVTVWETPTSAATYTRED